MEKYNDFFMYIRSKYMHINFFRSKKQDKRGERESKFIQEKIYKLLINKGVKARWREEYICSYFIIYFVIYTFTKIFQKERCSCDTTYGRGATSE